MTTEYLCKHRLGGRCERNSKNAKIHLCDNFTEWLIEDFAMTIDIFLFALSHQSFDTWARNLEDDKNASVMFTGGVQGGVAYMWCKFDRSEMTSSFKGWLKQSEISISCKNSGSYQKFYFDIY